MVVLVVGAGVVGLVMGSFLNVVLWRVPRGESIVTPGSHCTVCGTPLGAGELVPVVSWVVQRGRCRHCGTSVSIRYPVVELACGALFALLAWLLVS